MVVEERPDGQTRDAVEHEDEVGVLEGGVVAGLEEVSVEAVSATPARQPGLVSRLVSGLVEQVEHALDLGWTRAIARPGSRDGERERMGR